MGQPNPWTTQLCTSTMGDVTKYELQQLLEWPNKAEK